jgi:hypothetical protein
LTIAHTNKQCCIHSAILYEKERCKRNEIDRFVLNTVQIFKRNIQINFSLLRGRMTVFAVALPFKV